MKDPTLTETRSMIRVIEEAQEHGWTAWWSHRLLILEKSWNGTRFLVQVIFDRGLWGYALTFYRQGTFESGVKVVALRRDLFAHLAA